MFCPAAFKEERIDVLHALIRAHPLGTLVTHGSAGLSVNLVPFTLVDGDDGSTLVRAHVARGNDQLVDLRTGAEALVLFQGPQAYISPTWYATKQQHGRAVPTWNYVAVEVRGPARVIDDAQWLRSQLDALTLQQERDRADPWAVSDAPPAYIAGQMKGITGIEIPVRHIVGKWKTSQNQPLVNRAGVANGLRDAATPSCPMADLVGQSSAG